MLPKTRINSAPAERKTLAPLSGVTVSAALPSPGFAIDLLIKSSVGVLCGHSNGEAESCHSCASGCTFLPRRGAFAVMCRAYMPGEGGGHSTEGDAV